MSGANGGAPGRRAASYVRVSTREQAENNYSIEMQLEKLRAYCALQGWHVAGEYVDRGYSGTTDKRPDLARLLRDVEAGLVDVVAVYKLDRFFRSQRFLWATLHLLESRGVGLSSATETFDTTTPVGRAMVGMLGTFAQLERDTFMERSGDGMREAVAAGKYTGGIIAYGYRLNAATKELEIEPEEAKIVVLLYRWAADDGLTCWAMADRLNAMGIPTKYAREGRGIRGKATANVWRPGRVRNMLRNPAYKGVWEYGKRTAGRKADQQGRKQVLTAGKVPAIVDADTWARAQATLDRNAALARRNAKRDYLLSGLITCSCGRSYVGAYYDRVDGSEVRYYRCDWRKKRCPGTCTNPPLRAEDVEGPVWEDIRGYCKTPEAAIEALLAARALRHDGTDHAGELGRVEAKLAELDEQEARLVTLYTTGAMLSRAALDRDAARLEQARMAALRVKAEIERDLAGEEAEKLYLRGIKETLRAVGEGIDEAGPERRRELAHLFVDGIAVGAGGDGVPDVRVKYAFDRAARAIGIGTDSRAEPNHAALTLERRLGA